jgi:hypothetical protein
LDNCKSTSPSPLHTPLTPTSLVETLNFASTTSNSPTPPPQQPDQKLNVPSNGNESILKAKNNKSSPNFSTSPTLTTERCFPASLRSSPIKTTLSPPQPTTNGSFLMPPTLLSSRGQQWNNNNGSIGGTTTNSNSSANLSTFNAQLTLTSSVNPLTRETSKSRSNSVTTPLRCQNIRIKNNELIRPDKFSFSLISNNGELFTSNRINRNEVKSRASKSKLNRETDIMLIMLSFILLLSQVGPFLKLKFFFIKEIN